MRLVYGPNLEDVLEGAPHSSHAGPHPDGELEGGGLSLTETSPATRFIIGYQGP